MTRHLIDKAVETESAARPRTGAGTVSAADTEAGQPEAEGEVLRRFAAAVAAFDRGACAEEATGELTPDLYERLPNGPAKEAVRDAFRKLAADPPVVDREAVVRQALARLAQRV
ncbi:MAG TPA: hypothetical protein VFY39_17530 [Gammaproteobacteria bacterium]|nr:hypothetical protein [Gammaproteobacteria bacterium]